LPEIASTYKIAYHREKIEAYLRDEPVFPASLEMDLSSACNRKCPQCPSTTAVEQKNLELSFVERLFSRLEGQTRGLLLTGGEPTMAPTFTRTLKLARQYGFADVVVVTNGGFLNDDRVASALVENASAVRVSMYDWDAESCGALEPVMAQIGSLRDRIEREGSKLQIGVSALTSNDRAAGLGAVAERAREAGAHWIYFHPTCTNWEAGTPRRVDQSGVLEAIDQYRDGISDGFGVFVYRERYEESALEFGDYHTAHFLLVIGADGMNYLGAEVKYQPKHIIADVAGKWDDDFLWRSERLRRMRGVGSSTYPAIGSRHRGVLYNDFIERLMKSEEEAMGRMHAAHQNGGPLFPHIL